jgi:hypothetical protein
MIVDGQHVDPAMLRLALRGAARPMLVTDAMPPVGGTRSGFTLYGDEIAVRDGRCVRADGTLAGAVSTQERGAQCRAASRRLYLCSALCVHGTAGFWAGSVPKAAIAPTFARSTGRHGGSRLGWSQPDRPCVGIDQSAQTAFEACRGQQMIDGYEVLRHADLMTSSA